MLKVWKVIYRCNYNEFISSIALPEMLNKIAWRRILSVSVPASFMKRCT